MQCTTRGRQVGRQTGSNWFGLEGERVRRSFSWHVFTRLNQNNVLGINYMQMYGAQVHYVGIGITAIAKLFAREELKITQITPLCAFSRKLDGSTSPGPSHA